MNNNMDSLEFLINFFSALKAINVDEIDGEVLKVFFNRNNHKIKEYPEVDLSFADYDLSVLEQLNIIKKRRILKDKYKVLLNEDTSYRVLVNSTDEDVIVVLKYAAEYKVFQNVMTNKPKVSYEEKYSNITNDFVKEKYGDVITLVKHLKEGFY